MPDRREHPLHLVLAALVHDELDPARAEPPRARGSGPAVVELDAALERGQRGGGRLALDLGDVDLVDLVAGVGEAVGELAVVRQQQRAGRVGVEPADRDDARRVGDEPDDGRPPAGVARGRDDTGRLVQEHVGELAGARSGRPSSATAVAGGDEGVQRARARR